MNKDFDELMEWDSFDPVDTLAWLDAYNMLQADEEAEDGNNT